VASSNPQHAAKPELDLTAGRFYHITTNGAWGAAQRSGFYVHPSLSTEGFIHFSFRDQVAETKNLHFKNQLDLVLLEIDPDHLTADLKVELSRNGERFPHLYGPLNLDAVVRVTSLDASES
jgi:uncharacterized protein (DUF952 family)